MDRYIGRSIGRWMDGRIDAWVGGKREGGKGMD